MERQLWKMILKILKETYKRRPTRKDGYTDMDIVATWLWAVLHDRPVSWACKRGNWPPYERRKQPSPTTMSRRLRSAKVKALLQEIEHRVLKTDDVQCLVAMMDGKPMMVSGCSKDRQAGYGRAAACKAKGYKLHTIIRSNCSVAAWRIAPMNKDERVMAERLLRHARLHGYLLADANYDSNKLHAICDQRSNLQLVTPPRYGFKTGRGHRPQTPGRLRSIGLLENPQSKFGQELLKQRNDIERYFGNLTNWGGGLVTLPPWVRTHRRVHNWVQAKMIFSALRRHVSKTTYGNK